MRGVEEEPFLPPAAVERWAAAPTCSFPLARASCTPSNPPRTFALRLEEKEWGEIAKGAVPAESRRREILPAPMPRIATSHSTSCELNCVWFSCSMTIFIPSSSHRRWKEELRSISFIFPVAMRTELYIFFIIIFILFIVRSEVVMRVTKLRWTGTIAVMRRVPLQRGGGGGDWHCWMGQQEQEPALVAAPPLSSTLKQLSSSCFFP